MINVIKQEIDMEESLRKRLEIICDFCNATPTFINGSIRRIDKTNLSYIEPHKLIINEITYLFFNNCENVYINTLEQSISLTELERHIKANKIN